MNILHFTHMGFSARFFAGITIVSLLLSAFPAAFFIANASNTDAMGNVTLTVFPAPTAPGSEYVTVEFTGTGTLNLDGWTIEDTLASVQTRHTFGSISLTNGQSYKICGDAGTGVDCDATIDAGGNSVWNNGGDTATLKDELGSVVVSTTYASAASDTEYDNTAVVNFAPVGTVHNVEDDLYFATIQEAIDAATTNDGETIELTADVITIAQVTIDKEITLDGNGFTISPTFTKDSNSNNAAIGVIAVDNVTITDLIIDGSGGTNLHGVNVYEAEDLLLDELTITDNNAAVIVNSSVVTIENITTSGNRWYAINVDKKTSEDSELTIKNLSVHSENSPTTPHIYIDDTTKAATVIDEDSQYDFADFGNARVYTLKAVSPYPCELTDTLENTTFDTFSLGDVDGQNGWKSTGPFDQEVVTNTYGYADFGCQSLRVSNAVTSGSFGDQTFAAPIPDSVGDAEATDGGFAEGTRYNHFELEFDIASTKPDSEQSGLALSVSPDRGDGSRMSYLSFADTAAGIAVTFYDTPGETNPANFSPTSLGNLDRTLPHTIKFVMDMNDGSSNDVVKIYIDGVLAHTGTSWENYFRFDSEASAEQTPRLMKNLIIRASGGAQVGNEGEGFLFDNMSLEASFQEEPEVDPNDENQLTITAIKFHNRNADNNRDAGEEGLEGWEMRLYEETATTTWDLIATGTTNVSGQKKFPQQKTAGTYYVCEVAQLGWTQVAPAEDTQTLNISPNATEEGPYCTKTVYSDEKDRSTKPEIGNVSNDLENKNQFNFSGIKFENKNGDRDRDIGEEVLEGWTFNFYKEVAGDWTFVASSTTNDDGVYRFPTQYEAGVFHVCEESQIGWDQVRQDWSGTPYHIITDNMSPNASIEGPYCGSATYDDSADRSTKRYFGNMMEPKVVDYSTVTMCKYDEQDNPLSGWQLALIGDHADSLSFAPTAATQSMTNVPAGDYVLKADGAYKYRGGTNLLADARFSERKAGDAGFGSYPYQPWRITNPATGGLSVSVNGDEGALWGSVFSPSHIYYGGVNQASLGDIDFSMYDDAYGDNTGSIELTLSRGFTGITDDNGCVTFEDVPYGSYEVEELMQTGFENTSGLGAVEVDEEDETFVVVNNDLSYVPPCELTALSDEDTVIIENNAFATSTYEHSNWSASIPGANWIWEAYRVIDPKVNTVKTFEETFTVATPTTATLDVAADNSYRVFVNGVLVVDRSTNENNFQTHTQKTFTTEILDELVSGENTLRIEVTNKGVAGSNDRSNPAGLLYKLVVNGATDCAITTDVEEEEPEPTPATLVITNPATPGLTLSGTYDFTAEYNDDDETEDAIQWAIRAGTCAAGINTMAGNVDGFSDSSTFTAPNFSAIVNMSDWLNGNYCFVVNPSEQSGEDDLRATQEFILDNGGSTSPDPEEEEEVEGEEGEEEVVIQSTSGGGGGSNNATGQRFSNTLATASATPLVLGASTVNTCPFLLEYMQIGDTNNPLEVTKLQIFLNIFKDMFGGTTNPVTGSFGTVTDANVKAFQEHYRSEVLDPWFARGIVPHDRPTGFVYKTTLWKINSIVCPDEAVYPSFEGENLNTNVDNDINEPVQD